LLRRRLREEEEAGEKRRPEVGEGRVMKSEKDRLNDEFGPYPVHVYGPLQ
jgi:hypothetical protein